MNYIKGSTAISLAAVSLVIGLGFLTETAEAAKPKAGGSPVNCANPKESVQSAVDAAKIW